MDELKENIKDDLIESAWEYQDYYLVTLDQAVAIVENNFEGRSNAGLSEEEE